MSQNVFAVKDQAELNSLIHRPNADCAGDCDWCSKFHRASRPVNDVAKNGVVITLTANEEVIAANGYFRVWCEECSDGENDTFWECADWAERHAKRRHGAN